MKKFLFRIALYLLPASMDMVVGANVYLTSVRVAKGGGTPFEVTSIVSIWAAVYMITSQIAGKVTNEDNAGKILSFSTLITAGTNMAFILMPSLKSIYYIVAVQSLGLAFFFTPFQVFMKSSEGDSSSGVTRATGFYTFSWSMGMAAGPFVAAFIWEWLGWQYVFFFMSILCMILAVGIILLNNVLQKEKQYEIDIQRRNLETSSEAPEKEAVDYSTMPDLAWLGWVCAGLGCVTISILRSYFPSSATTLGVSKIDQGFILAVISASQAITGLLLAFHKTWMYRIVFLSLFGFIGIAGLILFGVGVRTWVFYVAGLLYGIYSGTFFFYLVFHSLVHPQKSAKYVSVNESIVGVSSIIGSISAGIIAEKISLTMPYYVAAFLVGIAILVQIIVHSSHKEQTLNLINNSRTHPGPQLGSHTFAKGRGVKPAES